MKDINFLKNHGVDVDKSIELFGDIEIYNETMQDFLDGISTKLERLEESKKKVDLNNYAVFAHSVKSDARYLGFTTVAEVALSHEMAGKESNQKHIEDDYSNFLININHMIDVVKEYLTGNASNVLNKEVADDLKKILVVDDSPLITNLVSKFLEGKYEVIVQNSGIDAKKYIEENNIDCILLDLNMPEVNGFDILNFLIEKDLFKRVKVSIITGDESKETIDKAFTYPIIDMLNKPFNLNDLTSVIDKTLM